QYRTGQHIRHRRYRVAHRARRLYRADAGDGRDDRGIVAHDTVEHSGCAQQAAAILQFAQPFQVGVELLECANPRQCAQPARPGYAQRQSQGTAAHADPVRRHA
ncbi:hypothetical protein LTR94_035423, partial [Friedmanniomyces endolithicus]